MPWSEVQSQLSGYWPVLLALAIKSAAVLALTAVVSAVPMRRPTLHRRLAAILDARQKCGESGRRALWVGLIGLIILLVPLAEMRLKAAGTVVTAGADSTQPVASTQSAGNAPDPQEEEIRVITKILPDVNFESVPFSDAMDQLRAMTEANIVVRNRTLEAAGVSMANPISLRMRHVTLPKGLNMILAMEGGKTPLGYIVDHGAIVVSTEGELLGKVMVFYDIGDLVAATDGGGLSQEKLDALCKEITGGVDPGSWKINGGEIGALSIFPSLKKLVITQTAPNQRLIIERLDKLRHALHEHQAK